MSMEHYRSQRGIAREGYYQGYYCSNCGGPVLSMYGSNKHGRGSCKPNKELVAILHDINTVEAENKREFIRKLKGQPEWTK